MSSLRSKGQDVWRLLDECIQEVLEEASRDGDANTLTSEDVAARTDLSPEVVRRFLSELDVRVVPSPPAPSSSGPPPPCIAGGTLRPSDGATGEQQQKRDEHAPSSRSPRHRAQGGSPPPEEREAGGESAAVSSFLSARNAFEARSRVSREGSPVRTASPPPSSSSPQFASVRSAYEKNNKKKGTQGGQSVKSEAPAPPSPPSPQEAPAICDRYLRTLSRDTASVRCRVQFYNQELARTLQEAESLVLRAAGTYVSSNSGSHERPSRLSPGIDDSAAARRGMDDRGDGGESIAAEVGGGMAAVNRGGGGGTAGMSLSGPIVAFSRVSPVGRADPSHPRMELVSPRCSRAQHPGPGSGIPPGEGGRRQSGQRKSSTDVSRRKNSGDEAKVPVSDRVAKLLLAAFDEKKASVPPSTEVAPPATTEKRKIEAAPKTACFDPPSVRNGMAGLTPSHVDKVLLRVEESTPGAVSSWKSPVDRRRPRPGGTENVTPSTLGRGLTSGTQGRRQRQLQLSQDSSIGWFDAQGSAGGILQEAGRAQGGAGGGPGARRKKGGGGARRKRSIMKIRLPPRTPRTPPTKAVDSGATQGALAAAQLRSS